MTKRLHLKEKGGRRRHPRYDRRVLTKANRVATLALIGPFGCGALACGCGNTQHAPAATCTESPQAVEAALTHAPGSVRLRDGTRLSQCVSRALDEGQLQSVGAVFTLAATDLAARARNESGAALKLGYLVGATRRGAATTNGVGLQLAHRVERAGALEGATQASLAAEHTGIVAGQRSG
jgi:hypothetical protein